MAKVTVAKLFWNGRTQAVRLPQEYRFEGDRVEIRRVGRGVLLLPVMASAVEWFGAMDAAAPEPFMLEGRPQPVAPVRDAL